MIEEDTLIDVQWKHIYDGKAHDPLYCPVALAIREKLSLKGRSEVYVGGTMIMVRGRRYTSPPTLCDWVEAFDRAEDGAPDPDHPDKVMGLPGPMSFVLKPQGVDLFGTKVGVAEVIGEEVASA